MTLKQRLRVLFFPLLSPCMPELTHDYESPAQQHARASTSDAAAQAVQDRTLQQEEFQHAITAAVRSNSKQPLEDVIQQSAMTVEMLQSQDAPDDVHTTTRGFTAANTDAALHEAFRMLASTELMAVLTTIVRTQAGVVAKQAVSEEGLTATRMSAKEAFAGSYDAVEKKWQEWAKGLPGYTMPMMAAAAAFAALFLLGIFLSVWRFALYGLS